jgi:hypothetical protein
MDSFLRRLKYYGLGFLLGLIFVIFFFKNRGCSWLPSNRVKSAILERVIVLSAQEKKLVKFKGLHKQDLLRLIQESEISFSESRREGKEKAYLLHGKTSSGDAINFFITLPEESFISEMVFSKSNASSVRNSSRGFGEVIHFPAQKDFIFFNPGLLNDCVMKTYRFKKPDDVFKSMKLNCYIDFSKSSFNRSPKPEHFLETRINDTLELGMRAVWYKQHINVVALDSPCN